LDCGISIADKVNAAMNPKSFWLITATLLVSVYRAEAQEAGKIPKIGYISVASRSVVSARVEAFQQGLHELGYEEAKNIIIVDRYADGSPDKVPDLVAELIRLKIDVILSAGAEVTRISKEATRTIPIVMASDNDPVGNGFVTSLARPGGNVTGLSSVSPDLSGKQLELLKEVVPKLSRVAVFGDSTNPGNAQALKETKIAATALNADLQYLNVVNPKDFRNAFRDASKGRCDAVLVVSSIVAFSQRKEIAELAIKNRLPVVYPRPEYVENDGLMFYGVDVKDLSRRAATYVDKILKGAKPGELPIEQPRKFELLINLKAAKQIGLTIPPNLLARADKVIK
jgi:putative ABC transport system substrate-binding protein